jgi:hypothetical protein
MLLDESKPAAYIRAVYGYSLSTRIRQENLDIVLCGLFSWLFGACKEESGDVLGDVTCVSSTIKSMDGSDERPI